MTKPNDGIKMNWPAIIATVIGLIGIGWCFGLIIHPPAAEVLYCPEEDMVQIEGRSETEGIEGVVVFCVDYRE